MYGKRYAHICVVTHFMRIIPFIIIFSSGQFLMACNHKKDDRSMVHYKVENVTLISEEDQVVPPPPGYTSRFDNLQAWLDNICNNEQPQKAIATYNFGLFEGQDNYTLCFTGTNTYEVAQDHIVTRIDFAPTEMYFSLPKSEYKGLERGKVLERLTAQLKDFITTDKFKHSFLSSAKSITTDWKGEIWSQ